MTNLPTAALLGQRTPRYRLIPPAASWEVGREAVDLADVAGLVLDPWEADVVVDTMGTRDDGRWASFKCAEIVPRQNGKGSILEARELYGLFRDPTCRLITHTAHEVKTAREAFRRIVTLIENSRALSSLVFQIRWTNGQEGIELKDGSRLLFIARSQGSGRGFTGDLVILDEAYNLDPFMLDALIPIMAARPNPQLWYTSSAPHQHERSLMLRSLCKAARHEDMVRMTYHEWCAEDDAQLDDEHAWAAANPGYGIRLNPDVIREELTILTPEGFARERLGIWDEDRDAKGHRVISKEAWEACHDADSEPAGDVRFAVDVSEDREWASIGISALSSRGGIHLELVDRRPGTGWVPARAKELQDRWGGEVIISKGSPAWSLKEDLEEAGCELSPVTAEQHAQACGDLYDAVKARAVRHVSQAELNVAVGGADRRYYLDSWMWSRRSSAVDITPLVAVTLAHRGRHFAPEEWPDPDII